MIRNRPTPARLGVVAATAAMLLPLAGCADDSEVPNETAAGAIDRTETIDALNLVLVTDGTGAARLVGTVINEAEQTDRLVGIDVDTEVGPYSLVFGEGPLTLPTDEPLELADDAEVSVISDNLRPGFMAELTLMFENSAPVVSQVPVRLQEGPYSDIEVIPPPGGSASAS